MKLILRGHHLLCLQGFQGYGYDEYFVKNMTEINLMRKSAAATITLSDSPDDICKSCPNLKENICGNQKQNERIISMDREVLSKLDTAMEYDAQDLFEKVKKIFNSKESVSKICSECIWHKECLFFQNL